MKCHLVHLTGPNKGLATSFESARVTVGRAASCDLHFDSFDVSVAPNHAEILVDEDGHYYVHDLGSRSGTYVNGERIHHRAMLRSEDILQFGEEGPEVVFRTGRAHPGFQPLPPEPLPFAEMTFVSGSDAGRTFYIPGDAPVRVGRRADMEIPLDPQGDLVVSGNHCTIQYWNTSFILTDTSRNGTFVNGHPVEGRALIQDGDEITFGEGGPRAQFRVMPARRVYPNLVARHAPAKSVTVGPAAAGADADADELDEMEESADEQPASDNVAEPPPADAREAARRLALRGARPIPAAPPQHRPKVPLKINLIRKHPAPIPRRFRKRRFGRTLALTALFLGAAAIGFLAWRATRQTTTAELTYSQKLLSQIEQASSQLAGGGRYSFLLPANWSMTERGPGVLLEPDDSSLVVDYYRAPGLTPGAVRKLVSMDGARVVDLTGQATGHGDTRVSGFLSRSGGTARLAVLHEPDDDVPAVALLEAPVEKFAEIPDTALARLLIEGIKLQDLAPKAPPAPEPTPLPVPEPPVPPAPVVVAEATPVQAPTPVLPPPDQPQVVTEPVTVAEAAPTTGPSVEATPAPDGPRVGSSLGLDLRVPVGWTGAEDEAEKVVLLHGPDQLDVRIARDPNTLDMNQLVTALEAEGWKPAARPTVTSRFHAVNLQKEEENVILVLVPEQAGSTIVVYSTKNGELSKEDREMVSEVVGDLLESVKE